MEEFFNDICKTYYEKILKYVYFNINDEDVANDITQDVFLVVYKKIDILYKHSNIGGFIFKTAKNIVKKYKREMYLKLINEIYQEDKMCNIADKSCNIDAVIDNEINEYDFIFDVIGNLSEEKRKLYDLYYINKKPMKQISKETGINYSALKMRYTRLRKEIQSIVKKIAEEKF